MLTSFTRTNTQASIGQAKTKALQSSGPLLGI